MPYEEGRNVTTQAGCEPRTSGSDLLAELVRRWIATLSVLSAQVRSPVGLLVLGHYNGRGTLGQRGPLTQAVLSLAYAAAVLLCNAESAKAFYIK